MTNPHVLNEAFAYEKPSSFSRGMRIDIGNVVILLISGTASIDEAGNTVHVGDFRAQCRRTYQNITGLLESEGATWHDHRANQLLPARHRPGITRSSTKSGRSFSPNRTGPVASLDGHRSEAVPAGLLVEMEAIAMFKKE